MDIYSKGRLIIQNNDSENNDIVFSCPNNNISVLCNTCKSVSGVHLGQLIHTSHSYTNTHTHTYVHKHQSHRHHACCAYSHMCVGVYVLKCKVCMGALVRVSSKGNTIYMKLFKNGC